MDAGAKSIVTVRIFGTPMACSRGVTDAWRQVAEHARTQLSAKFGDSVSVEYHDLFSPDMDGFPEVMEKVRGGAQVPLVFVGGEMFSAGGKISTPALAKRIEELRRA